jgi:hypothetical protein
MGTTGTTFPRPHGVAGLEDVEYALRAHWGPSMMTGTSTSPRRLFGAQLRRARSGAPR